MPESVPGTANTEVFGFKTRKGREFSAFQNFQRYKMFNPSMFEFNSKLF